jgi:hypothetical protein
MKIILDNEESEKFFHNALCNSMGEVCGYGLSFGYDGKEYKAAAKKLKDESPNSEICREDVWMQILKDGGSLYLIDDEDDDEEKHIVTLKDVHKKVSEVDVRHLTDMINENDDAYTGDAIIQTVFFGEIVYG